MGFLPPTIYPSGCFDYPRGYLQYSVGYSSFPYREASNDFPFHGTHCYCTRS